MSDADIQLTHTIRVSVKQAVGNDATICDAARVSTLGDGVEDRAVNPEANEKLIRYLMRDKHGSPFEHGSITFIVTAPIFVFWDHVRHRIGVSYNIESSRYRELKPLFYVADQARVQTGKPGHYVMAPGNEGQTNALHGYRWHVVNKGWEAYQALLDAGVAREQAMEVLPMCTVITGYVTFNPRSLMNFLELRLGPAREEMKMVARGYLEHFKEYWPVTAEAFKMNGMIAP